LPCRKFFSAFILASIAKLERFFKSNAKYLLQIVFYQQLGDLHSIQ
jgi:hypothetical protein